MGLLGKLFGGRSPQERVDRATALMEAGDFGSAKLELDKALDRADGALRDTISDRIAECCDAMALERLEEAKRLLAQGDTELARQELDGALEVARGAAAQAAVQAVIDGLEAEDAVERAADSSEVSDEERWVLISGSWERPQAEEYEAYGEAFERALLALHDGRPEEARPLLESVLEEAEAPRYLWLEVGRARLLTDDREGGREALIEFVESLAEDEVGQPLLAAYIELARIAHEDEEFEEAMAFYERAVEEFDEDHRPYLAMGIFLRDTGHVDEAIGVLEAGASLMDEMRPDWMLMQELGHAYALAGRDKEAIAQLEAVISFMTARQILDFPPRSARKLAELHEQQGKLERAADLYAQLARGSDRANHPLYYKEAGRLLHELGLDSEARRLLKRAQTLLSNSDEPDAELSRTVDALLRATEGSEEDVGEVGKAGGEAEEE